MKIKKLSIIALALSFVLLISCNGLSPVNAREQQPKGALISSASGKEFAEVAEALAPKISPLKYSRSSSKPAGALRFACDPSSVGVSQYEGGTIANCKKKDLEVSDTDSALVEIKPGAARAPHWHDTWEQQTLISGKAKTYLIDEKGQVNVEVLTPGMVAFLPAGMTHWTETVGTQTAILSLSFPAGFKTFELGDSLIQVRKIDNDCASSSNLSCNAKPKSPILIVKDGLI
ncbi:cupin domain-containing protein [Synechococcus sp. UW140]|uniref:cupin domain-containing protein n=1 Tax=Synechococcus sp. UW140 TaxID=368503 RepID=UPI0031381456